MLRQSCWRNYESFYICLLHFALVGLLMKYVIEFRPIPADATCTNCAGLQAKANSSARKNGTETERSLTLSSNEKMIGKPRPRAGLAAFYGA